jgi:hypothetical protein
MSILDDAIREHLELKRAHGADEGELQKLEDEAFGPPQRPDEVDPFNEAPTQFLLSPDDDAADAPEIGDEAERSGRRPNITDLQEAPPAEPVTGEADAAQPAADAPLFDAEDELSPAPDAPPPSPADAAEVPLPPPPDEAPAAAVPPPTDAPAPEEVVPAPTDVAPPVDDAAAEIPPVTDEAPAAPPAAEIPPVTDETPAAPTAEEAVAEHEIVTDAGPDTDERHTIADQPTQMFDVQNHIDAEVEAPAEQASPSDDELVDAAQSEPQAAPPAPEDAGPPTELYEQQQPLDTRGPDAEVAGHPPTEEESAEFDFFNEQRLSEELDQALEAPLPPTDEHVAMPQYDDAPAGQAGIFDFESASAYEEDPSEEVLRRHDTPTPEPPSEEYEQPSEEYEPPSEETPRAAAERDSEESPIDYDPDTGHEDVLEDTPRFLEDAPEDDDLWFEQKPPKDFDLD